MSDPIFVGIDVSSQTLEVWRSDQSESQQFSNDGAGIDALEQQPRQLPVGLLVLEATGGYEFEAAYTLQASGLAVAVVNPRMARDFARAMGLLAKTDALDARMLTGFAQVLHQHPQRDRFIKPLADAQLQQLQALVLRRRQIVQMLTAERHRLRLAHAAARPSIQRHIAFLKAEQDDCDGQVSHHVQQHHAELAQVLSSVPGVGATSMAVLLAELPELGRLDRRRIAALVGGAHEPRFGQAARASRHHGRASRRAMHSIHGYLECRALQRRRQSVLSASGGTGKAQESCIGGLHAKNADHPQYHGKASYMLES